MTPDAIRSQKLGRLADSRVSRHERLAQRADAVWAEAAAQFRLCEREVQDAEERRSYLKASQFAALCRESVSGAALQDQTEACAQSALLCAKAQEQLIDALRIKEESEDEARRARLEWLNALNRTQSLKALLEERIAAERIATEERLEMATADDVTSSRLDRRQR